MSVERTAEQGTEFSNRIKQNPISQRFLRVGASIALAVAALAPDNVSTFVRPASAAESTATILTWVNICGPSAHVPYSDQSILNSVVNVRFLVPQDAKSYVSTYQDWVQVGVTYLTQRQDNFYYERMGIRYNWDGQKPAIIDLPQTTSFYIANPERFATDVSSISISVASTPDKHAHQADFYITDPTETNFTRVLGSLRAWGGWSGKNGYTVTPALSLKPTLSANNKEAAVRTFLHETGHSITSNPTDSTGAGHDADSSDIMYPVININVPEGQVYISGYGRDLTNTCPNGYSDQFMSNLRNKIYLPYTIKS